MEFNYFLVASILGYFLGPFYFGEWLLNSVGWRNLESWLDFVIYWVTGLVELSFGKFGLELATYLVNSWFGLMHPTMAEFGGF